MHVRVILSDMTDYCDTLWEISSAPKGGARPEGRSAYPGSMLYRAVADRRWAARITGGVSPNRMELLRMKKKQQFARRGHKLLKGKLEGLLKDFTGIVEEYAALLQPCRQRAGRAVSSSSSWPRRQCGGGVLQHAAIPGVRGGADHDREADHERARAGVLVRDSKQMRYARFAAVQSRPPALGGTRATLEPSAVDRIPPDRNTRGGMVAARLTDLAVPHPLHAPSTADNVPEAQLGRWTWRSSRHATAELGPPQALLWMWPPCEEVSNSDHFARRESESGPELV